MSRILILAAAAAVLATPALAYEVRSTLDGGSVVTVSAASVDFNDPAQVKAFYASVKSTADEACRVPSLSSQISRPDADCTAAAVARVVGSVNRPLLTAAYSNDSGERDVLVRQAGH